MAPDLENFNSGVINIFYEALKFFAGMMKKLALLGL